MGAYILMVDLGDAFPEDRILLLAQDELDDPLGAEVTLEDIQDGTHAAGSTEAKVQRRIERAVGAAEAKAEAILSPRLAVPVASPTADLLLAIKQIAIRHLFQRKPETEDGYKREYDEALDLLEAIRDGDAQVPGGTEADSVVSTGDGDSESVGSRSEFAGGSLDDF